MQDKAAEKHHAKQARAEAKAKAKHAKIDARAREEAERLKAQERAKLPALTDTELVQRMRLHSPAVVEEIHAVVQRQLQAEDQREARLDSKAQGLLGTAGLSLTVAFTFGGLLLEHPEYLEPLTKSDALGRWPARCVILLYALALLAGLVASVHAVWGLFVTAEHRGVDERDVLNPDELASVDNEYSQEAVRPLGDRELGDARARTVYRRYLVVHLWLIWQRHFRLHGRKADIIKRGQISFVVFVGALLLIGAATTFSALWRLDRPVQAEVPVLEIRAVEESSP